MTKKNTQQLNEDKAASKDIRNTRSKPLKSKANHQKELVPKRPELELSFQIDEKKIINEFLTKRKLLMKALKLKQKTERAHQITIQKTPLKEGDQQQLKNVSTPKKLPSSSRTQSKQQSNTGKSLTLPASSKLSTQREKIQSQTCASIGIQTPSFLEMNKSISKNPQPQKPTSAQNTKVSGSKYKKKQTHPKDIKSEIQVKQKRRPAVSPSQVQTVKKKMFNLYIKTQLQREQITNSNSLSKFSYETKFQHDSQQFQANIISQMTDLNHKIQRYYDNKPLKQVILAQFYEKYNKKRENKKKQLRPYQIMQMKQKQQKQQRKKIRKQKLQKQKQIAKIIKQRTTRIPRQQQNKRKDLNERFKLTLMEKSLQTVPLAKQNEIFHQEEAENRLTTTETKHITDENQSTQSETLYQDSYHAWKSQFKVLSSMILDKYPNIRQKIQSKKMDKDKRSQEQRLLQESRRELAFYQKKTKISNIKNQQPLQSSKFEQIESKKLTSQAIKYTQQKSSKTKRISKKMKMAEEKAKIWPEQEKQPNFQANIKNKSQAKVEKKNNYQQKKVLNIVVGKNQTKLKEVHIDPDEYEALGRSCEGRQILQQCELQHFQSGETQLFFINSNPNDSIERIILDPALSNWNDSNSKSVQKQKSRERIISKQKSRKQHFEKSFNLSQSLNFQQSLGLQSEKQKSKDTLQKFKQQNSSSNESGKDMLPAQSKHSVDIPAKNKDWQLFRGEAGNQYLYMSQEFE